MGILNNGQQKSPRKNMSIKRGANTNISRPPKRGANTNISRPPKRVANATLGNVAFPSKFYLDGALMYSRLRFNTGCTLHIFGERHANTDTCRPPKFYTIPCLIDDLVKVGKETKKQIDVYIERRASQLHPKSVQGRNEKSLHGMLLKYKNIIPFQQGAPKNVQSQYVRMHVTDLRNSVYHPFVLWSFMENEANTPQNEFDPYHLEFQVMGWSPMQQRAVSQNRRRILDTLLKSNSYANNVGSHFHNNYRSRINPIYGKPFNQEVPFNPRRNMTTYKQKSVSRLRKQILKLGRGLDTAMLRLFDRLYYQNYALASVLITDMYALARMLFYAGFGKQHIRSPSKVAVLYGGALHAHNQRFLLHALDLETKGALGIAKEDFLYELLDEPDAELYIKKFKTGFE